MLLVAVPLLAMLPNLIVRENQIEFRILPGLCVVMWVYASTSAYFVARTVAGLIRFDIARLARLADGMCLVVVVGLAVLCRQHIAETMILPNQTKDAYIRSALQGFDSAKQTAIVVVDDYAWWRHRPRIGTFSIRSDLMFEWVAVPDVKLVAREAGIAMSDVSVSVTPRLPTDAPQALIIDLSVLEPILNGP